MSEPRSRESDRAHWAARHAAGEWRGAPSAWVVEQGLALPKEWTIVELAAGAGRHASALARAGRSVVAVDFIEMAVRAATKSAGVNGVTADSWSLPFRERSLDALLVVSYLERALLPAFARLLRPGGRLIYETFTAAHGALVVAGRAHGPRNPAYLLQPGELPDLVPLTVLEYSEVFVSDGAGERHVGRLVAAAD